MKILSTHVLDACRKNIVLPLCFLGVIVIRLVLILFNTFLLLRITSFVDTGVLADDNEAKKIIRNINLIAVCSQIFFFKISGAFADKYPAYVTIPISFFLRAMSIFAYITITDPRSIMSYIISVLLVLSSFLENTTIDGLFTKNLPKDIRGTLNGIYAFFGQIGILIFAKVGGYLYDNMGPTYPFIFVAICDLVFCAFVVALRLLKIFNH
jgi:MFS family permease